MIKIASKFQKLVLEVIIMWEQNKSFILVRKLIIWF